jgi:hypothetical protein
MATISDASDCSLVNKILTEKWSQYGLPLHINEDNLRINENDLIAGTRLLTQIAVEAVGKGDSVKKSDAPRLSTTRKISLETAWGKTVGTIKEFVEARAYDFGKVCQTGFPFSLLESRATESALKHALKYHDSILSHFMTFEESWMSESELDERFKKPFQRVQASEIARACSNLQRAYVRDKDHKAGYYLLWLIKQATGLAYKIPDKSSFNNATVAKVLSECFASSDFPKNPANFVEILHSRSSRPDRYLYQEFLDQGSSSIFLDFAVRQLVDIAMDRWPNKADIITDLLAIATPERKLAAAKDLSLSKDPITSKIGNHLLAGLTLSSLTDVIPHFNALIDLLPNFNYTDIEIIFGRPFVEFCHDSSIYKNAKFAKRLNFNDMRKVFIHGSLMMGVFTTHGNTGMPPYLLAYDMNTEKMVWGIPLTPRSLEAPSLNTSVTPTTFGIPRIGPAGYFLEKMGELLFLHFAGENKLHFIHPETGNFDFTLELPGASTDSDDLHISPKGFAYQIVHKDKDRILIGGRIIDKRWNSSFETKTPSGLFRPFSTHCGFQKDFEDSLVLFGPTGGQVTIEDCMAAEAQDDKLYSVEKDPGDNNKCLLKIRTLKDDEEVFSGVEKSIPLNLKDVYFGKVCQNGQLVLFSGRFSDISPIFVDLHTQKVTYSQHKFPFNAKHIINADSGELWTWDQESHKIWKVSSTTITLMGSMESDRGTTFLHVDKADHLYFVDIPP